MSQFNTSIGAILNSWVAGEAPTDDQWQYLITEALADESSAKAFGLDLGNITEKISQRSQLFSSIYPLIIQQSRFSRFPPDQLRQLLWQFWLPLAMKLAEDRENLTRPLIQGILGGQGTGKSTLAAILSLILEHLGYRTLSLSLDDLYKTYAERVALQAQNPRLIWRGPPGTHDVQLGLQVLQQLKQPEPHQQILVPRFDKSAWNGLGDRTNPEIVQDIDIVLFEGWFVGARPISPSQFATAPAPISTPADQEFACEMNELLKDYLPLWGLLDQLMVIYPADYRISQQWRWQAEAEMIASGKSGMTQEMVNQFVEYFWKALHPELFIQPLTEDANWVDIVIKVNSDRSIAAIYSKRQKAEGRRQKAEGKSQ